MTRPHHRFHGGRAVRWLAGVLSISTLAACAGHRATTPPPSTPTRSEAGSPAEPFDVLAPRGRIQLHWNDAADTVRTLRSGPNRPLRITATVTEADSLRGFTLLFRLRPARPDGTAWTFQPRPGCEAAGFVISAERDSMAPAPWKRKLLFTDKVDVADGDRLFYVIAAYDDVILNPDSTYSLCHLDLQPAEPSDGGMSCGWDAPMQISLDVARLSLFGRDIPARDFGHGLRYEPTHAP
jgi:hypothetical protein